MRCSKCLSHMETRGGKTVCAGCGTVADFRNDDGTMAVFASPARGRGARGMLAWVTLGVLALLGAGAILVARQHFPEFFAPAGPAWTQGADLAPSHRTAIARAFPEGLREDLIATLGTGADDTVLDAAIQADGRIAILVSPRPAGGPAPARLVRLSGTHDLLVSAPLQPGMPVAGALQASATGESLMALTGEGSTWITASGPDGARRWSRSFPSDVSQGDRVLLGHGDAQAIVLMPGELDGQLSLVALGPSGDLRWQRALATAPAPGAGRLGVDTGGDIAIAFMRAQAGGQSSARLMRLTGAGQDIWQSDIALAPGSALSGLATLPDGATALLHGARLPRLAYYAGNGEEVWARDIPASLLNDSLFLIAGPGGTLTVLSAFRLSDVVTDLALTQFSPGGDLLLQTRLDLPAGALVDAVMPQGNGALLVFGSLAASQAEDRDIFVLSLERPEAGDAPIAAERPVPAGAGPDNETGRAQEPGAAVAQPEAAPAGTRMPEPVNDEAPLPEETGPVPPAPADGAPAGSAPLAPASSLDCRFVCRDGEEAFVLWQALDEFSPSLETRIAQAHVQLCARSGGLPDPGTRPECN